MDRGPIGGATDLSPNSWQKLVLLTVAGGAFVAGGYRSIRPLLKTKGFLVSNDAGAVAMRALFAGTALCGGTFAAGYFAIKHTLGVNSMEEFAVKVRSGTAGIVQPLASAGKTLRQSMQTSTTTDTLPVAETTTVEQRVAQSPTEK